MFRAPLTIFESCDMNINRNIMSYNLKYFIQCPQYFPFAEKICSMPICSAPRLMRALSKDSHWKEHVLNPLGDPKVKSEADSMNLDQLFVYGKELQAFQK